MNTLLLDACAGSAQIVKCGCDIANATNGQDVEIAKAICCSIVTLAGIIVGGFLIWKLITFGGCFLNQSRLSAAKVFGLKIWVFSLSFVFNLERRKILWLS